MSTIQNPWGPEVDLYADLELDPTASQEDVRKSYKRLALRYHPDKQYPGQMVDTALFTQVREAYEVLGNIDSRRRYDVWLSYQWRPSPRKNRWREEAEIRRQMEVESRRQKEEEIWRQKEAESSRRRQEEEESRRLREAEAARREALFQSMNVRLEEERAEKAAREHAEKVRQADKRSQAAIRRRQKEADRMARLRLQQQNRAEERQVDQNQTHFGTQEPHQQPTEKQRAAPLWMPVRLGKTTRRFDQTQVNAEAQEPHQQPTPKQSPSLWTPVSAGKTTMSVDDERGGGGGLWQPSSRQGGQFWSRQTKVQRSTHLRGQMEDLDHLDCGCAAGAVRSGLRNCDFCAKPRPVVYHCVECKASACSTCKDRFC